MLSVMRAEPHSSDTATGRALHGRASKALVDVAAHLPVGRALDLGYGEGGDAIWLAVLLHRR